MNHSCPNVTDFVPEKTTPRHERYETPIEGGFVTGFVPYPGRFVGKRFRAQNVTGFVPPHLSSEQDLLKLIATETY